MLSIEYKWNIELDEFLYELLEKHIKLTKKKSTFSKGFDHHPPTHTPPPPNNI